MQSFDEELDQWLDAIMAVPKFASMTAGAQEQVEIIVTVSAQVLVIGYQKQPKEWTTALLEDLFFNRFVPMLDVSEKRAELFDLLPETLLTWFDVLEKNGQLNQADQLRAWVKQHVTQLTALYDPVADKFYAQLMSAMKTAGVDLADTSAVSQFTKNYLEQHPDEGQALFTKKQ